MILHHVAHSASAVAGRREAVDLDGDAFIRVAVEATNIDDHRILECALPIRQGSRVCTPSVDTALVVSVADVQVNVSLERIGSYDDPWVRELVWPVDLQIDGLLRLQSQLDVGRRRWAGGLAGTGVIHLRDGIHITPCQLVLYISSGLARQRESVTGLLDRQVSPAIQKSLLELRRVVQIHVALLLLGVFLLVLWVLDLVCVCCALVFLVLVTFVLFLVTFVFFLVILRVLQDVGRMLDLVGFHIFVSQLVLVLFLVVFLLLRDLQHVLRLLDVVLLLRVPGVVCHPCCHHHFGIP
mmetsp:Transcript_49213/g.123326  ORF Transcript_49213/g.123326 Transcript_49213/m.123326 type:complete len:296 (-) Transcript_49213:124-1011(-)